MVVKISEKSDEFTQIRPLGIDSRSLSQGERGAGDLPLIAFDRKRFPWLTIRRSVQLQSQRGT